MMAFLSRIYIYIYMAITLYFWLCTTFLFLKKSSFFYKYFTSFHSYLMWIYIFKYWDLVRLHQLEFPPFLDSIKSSVCRLELCLIPKLMIFLFFSTATSQRWGRLTKMLSWKSITWSWASCLHLWRLLPTLFLTNLLLMPV